MSFLEEVIKLQRRRTIYLRFALANNPGVDWAGETERLFGKFDDARGPIPIKGTVMDFGTFNRSVTNQDFDFESPSITVGLLDENNEWRILAIPPSHRLLYRWIHLIARVADDTGLYFDERIAVGQITNPTFPAGKKVSLATQVTGGAFLGELIPRRLVSLADFPRAAPEEVGKAVPIVYGVLSNRVLTGTDAPASLTPATGCSESGTVVANVTFSEGPPLTAIPQYGDSELCNVVSGAGRLDTYGVRLNTAEFSGDAGFTITVSTTGPTDGTVDVYYRWSQTALNGNNNYNPLIGILEGAFNSIVVAQINGTWYDDAPADTCFIELSHFSDEYPKVSLGSAASLADTWAKVQLCWQNSSAEGVADGWIRVYLNDTQIIYWTGRELWISGWSHIGFGLYGLAGDVDDIQAWSRPGGD